MNDYLSVILAAVTLLAICLWMWSASADCEARGGVLVRGILTGWTCAMEMP